MTLRILKPVCTLFLYICAATATVAQQIPTSEPQPGTIIGTVLDSTGAAVPQARVVLKGRNEGDVRWFVTQQTGFFRFDTVKAGIPYRITVSAKGFADWNSNDITLAPGQYFMASAIELKVATAQVTVTVVPSEQIAVEQLKAQKQQRIVGVIPNFYVVYEHNAAPLTPKMKFDLAFRFLVDPVTFAGFGLNAGFYQLGGYPSYDQNLKGFGQRLGATFVGGYTNILVGDAILPSLLHQDPRYFYQGTGTTSSRLKHALSSPFIGRGDNGQPQINFSSLGGDLASSALAETYHPGSNRGPGLVFGNFAIGTGERIVSAVLQEFVLRKLTPSAKK